MNSRFLLVLIAAATLLIVTLAFGSHRDQKQPQSIQWNLIWGNEFTGSGAVNGSDWIYDPGTAYGGSGCPAN